MTETSRSERVVEHPTREERAERGRAARSGTPLSALAEFDTSRRPDPLDLLERQATSRVPELVPVRYGRMAETPFSFYRGAALVMADDLSRGPTTTVLTQLCGDAHMSNFGIFATPERKLTFDINDFDETYPGPFEWDVKRLVTSLVIAARDNTFTGKQQARIARACAAEYRETIARQAERGNLAVWYSHIEPSTELTELRDELDSSMKKRLRKTLEKSRHRDSVQALSKLTEVVDGRRRIISTPPLIVPIEEVFAAADLEQLYQELHQRLRDYRSTLQWDRRVLLEQFEFVQAARKVVGVGSVGTRAWIFLLRGTGDDDPLFLQAKEAQRSVLSYYVDGPTFANEGERVVNGQRLMQAASDIFLGWQQGPGPDGVRRDFYLRQLRDGKGSAVVEAMTPTGMTLYGRLCGRVLAYGHARSGDRIAIAEYLGSGTEFDDAITAFAIAYAEQNTRDHAALLGAISEGRITARRGI
ncbi:MULTISPECIES: DUF2252 domain-containing protein [unclassified Rhodococcus (in: high G+C Gram-positive bacteria)]|uniref:DUF2252 domain-containing protein n=1 Tax=unclassified Rhodococcus (in: high G+C Gram-positive bacteria) TaxID=192944 RepID=UPI000929E460|nr:DUF2252 domain-containing protein [Rhodococcus sp. M8]OLL20062.1 hypothetical protein BKE56_008810 [Rhodococcus sp. M8]QPG43905.1 DUF2252 domain-containing protein [Rhodococcus sp. M8]